MYVITAENVNVAYRLGLLYLHHKGVFTPSRNGPVLRSPVPVTTVYRSPQERVLLNGQRNANPFFHLFESLWMLNGQNDVATLKQFLPSFGQFSDDGTKLHGAYGYRWRKHFNGAPFMDSEFGIEFTDHKPLDQLALAIKMLKANPNDRRVVVGMWDPSIDLGAESKDIPCNDIIKFAIVDKRLDMQVFCRSNDMIFGAYGANAVHMSFLQEYIASMVGVQLGTYYQISADFHAYTERPYRWDTYWPDQSKIDDPSDDDPYKEHIVEYPLVAYPESFDDELAAVMSAITEKRLGTLDLNHYFNPFFRNVVQPMYLAHGLMQQKNIADARQAMQILRTSINALHITRRKSDGRANDWLYAAHEWCSRVIMKRSETSNA